MEQPKTPTSLQVRVGTKNGLSWETYSAMRHTSIDERKTLGELIEEAWAARQQHAKSQKAM